MPASATPNNSPAGSPKAHINPSASLCPVRDVPHPSPVTFSDNPLLCDGTRRQEQGCGPAGLSLAGVRCDRERDDGIISHLLAPCTCTVSLCVRGCVPVPTAAGTRRAVTLSLLHLSLCQAPRCHTLQDTLAPSELEMPQEGPGSPGTALPAPSRSRCAVAAFLACSLPRIRLNGRKALQRVPGVGNVYCLASETLESDTGKAQSQSSPGCSTEPELQLKGSEQRGRGKATACKHAAKKTLLSQSKLLQPRLRQLGDRGCQRQASQPCRSGRGVAGTSVMDGACGSSWGGQSWVGEVF